MIVVGTEEGTDVGDDQLGLDVDGCELVGLELVGSEVDGVLVLGKEVEGIVVVGKLLLGCELLGSEVGIDVGTDVGKEVGTDVGKEVGIDVGSTVGEADGATVGRREGRLDFATVGARFEKEIGSLANSFAGGIASPKQFIRTNTCSRKTRYLYIIVLTCAFSHFEDFQTSKDFLKLEKLNSSESYVFIEKIKFVRV